MAREVGSLDLEVVVEAQVAVGLVGEVRMSRGAPVPRSVPPM